MCSRSLLDVSDTSYYSYFLCGYTSCKCLPCVSATLSDDVVFILWARDDTWGPCISASIPPLHVEKEWVENEASKLTGQVQVHHLLGLSSGFVFNTTNKTH